MSKTVKDVWDEFAAIQGNSLAVMNKTDRALVKFAYFRGYHQGVIKSQGVLDNLESDTFTEFLKVRNEIVNAET